MFTTAECTFAIGEHTFRIGKHKIHGETTRIHSYTCRVFLPPQYLFAQRTVYMRKPDVGQHQELTRKTK